MKIARGAITRKTEGEEDQGDGVFERTEETGGRRHDVQFGLEVWAVNAVGGEVGQVVIGEHVGCTTLVGRKGPWRREEARVDSVIQIRF